ncbi:hypothetical protein [Brevibacillus sp. 179-C9.3 HS]|uniref:hypothetical protein n=1 Tax=unclassified Brevibacillus TaxID=2684853 RepID=UPI0039A19ED7
MCIASSVQRYIAEKPSTYRVIGLVMVKPQVDCDSGQMGIDFDLLIGDIDEPVNFLSFFQYAQQSLIAHHSLTN